MCRTCRFAPATLNNREQLGSVPPKAVGSEGFAEVGVNLRLFNRNQGNIETAKASQERASSELQRVSLVLRQLAAPILQNYESSVRSPIATKRGPCPMHEKRMNCT